LFCKNPCSTNLCNEWETFGYELPIAEVQAFAINNLGQIYATVGDGVYKTTNNGENWHLSKAGMNNIRIPAITVTNNNLIFAGTYSLVYRSTNNGLTWTSHSSGLASSQTLSIASNSTGILFLGNLNGGLYRSNNNGENWERVGLFTINGSVNDIEINLNDYIFVGTSQNIYRSTNHGNDFTKLNTGLPSGNIYRIVINYSNQLFLIINGKIYRSTNHGDSWANFSDGIPSAISVTSLAISPDGYIYAGTYGSGLYKTIYSTTDVKEIKNTSIDLYILSQNYPNPFNPSTTIKFALPERANVKLSIYNLLGENVAELVNGEMDAGYHETQWHANGFANGVYFYTLVVSPPRPPQ
ncbi:MAG: T9SS type A sorting domain-containing protein, partial [Proteobacteria bacterium]|nr:T9SS type A sorting domain-containing protein [Pseudomonadota bacterium]